MSNALVKTVQSQLNGLRDKFVMALPSYIEPNNFFSTSMNYLSKHPGLAECDVMALYRSFMLGALDGLLVNDREACIVPFWDKKLGRNVPQYMQMFQGTCKLVYNTGIVSTIHSAAVYSADNFEEIVDQNGPRLVHRPATFSEDRGALLGYYAIAKMKDGATAYQVMTMKEIEKRKAVSRNANNPGSPWQKWAEEMAQKTVIKSLCKKLPKSNLIYESFQREATQDPGTIEVDSKPVVTQPRAELPDEQSGPAALEAKIARPEIDREQMDKELGIDRTIEAPKATKATSANDVTFTLEGK